MGDLTPAAQIALYFIGQSVILLIAMVTAYVKLQIAIATLQNDVVHIYDRTDQQHDDHASLRDKVDGISRHVERLDASSD